MLLFLYLFKSWLKTNLELLFDYSLSLQRDIDNALVVVNARHRDQVLFPVLQNRNYPHLALAAALEEENVRERGEREEDVSELAQKCSKCDCGSYFTCTDPVGLGVARAVSHIREPVHLEQSRATLSRTEPDRCAVELLQHRRRDSRARLFSLVR